MSHPMKASNYVISINFSRWLTFVITNGLASVFLAMILLWPAVCLSKGKGGWKITTPSRYYATRTVDFRGGMFYFSNMNGKKAIKYGFSSVGPEYMGHQSATVEYFRFIPEGLPKTAENIVNVVGQEFRATALSEEDYQLYLQQFAK